MLERSADKTAFRFNCGVCGGELLGTSPHGTCPRCGQSIDRTLRTRSVAPATFTVADDTKCVGCGYNLHSLPIGGVCPECSRRVLDAIVVNPLTLVDQRWLRRVRRGVVLLTVLGFGCLVLGVVPPGITIVAEVVAPEYTWAVERWARLILVLLLLPVGLCGVWEATASEPHAEGPKTARRIA
jgi:predicted RNA-binding Zn-ribbon protein involved in translation (DUF1610 family)